MCISLFLNVNQSYIDLLFSHQKMVRTYKPKTERRSLDEESIKNAVSEVILNVLSIRKAAKKYGVNPTTLQYRIKIFRKVKENQLPSCNVYGSKYAVAQVFSAREEKLLTHYILTYSKMHCRLSLQQLLTLAYEYAVYLGCKYPESWKRNKRAGKDWGTGFRNRNQELSLINLEQRRITRRFAYNKTAVAESFHKFEHVMLHYKFNPDHIDNLGETDDNTVLMQTPKVLAKNIKASWLNCFS